MKLIESSRLDRHRCCAYVGAALAATLWAVVLLKLEAVILLAYGLILTSVGLLVQARVIHPSVHADTRALAWHAFLWDPWFLILGLAVALAVRPRPTARRHHS